MLGLYEFNSSPFAFCIFSVTVASGSVVPVNFKICSLVILSVLDEPESVLSSNSNSFKVLVFIVT